MTTPSSIPELRAALANSEARVEALRNEARRLAAQHDALLDQLEQACGWARGTTMSNETAHLHQAGRVDMAGVVLRIVDAHREAQ